MWFCGDGVLLPPRAAESPRLVPGDTLACHYNGVGDYLTVRRSAY